ncbi:hypothetical protein QUB17_32145, partial [Microcoleus sp. B5-C4]
SFLGGRDAHPTRKKGNYLIDDPNHPCVISNPRFIRMIDLSLLETRRQQRHLRFNHSKTTAN